MKAMATNHFKYISLLILLCALVSTTTQAQYTLTDDDVVVTDGEITSYSATETDIIIPNMLDGQVITSIGTDAFREKGLISVDLSGLSNLTSIGNFAFYNNSISSVDFTGLTNLTTIGDYAFRDNSISTIDFTDLTNLTTIGTYAFRANSISTIDFTDLTNLTTIGDYAFFYNSITSVDFTDLTNLTTIGSYAFHSNSVTSFVLPTPLKEGYTYSWSDGETNYANGDIIDDLAATYTAAANLEDYTIAYHADGGSHDNATNTYTVEDDVTLNPASKSGYIFSGWYMESEFTNEITEIEAGTTGDLNLYARYQYTLTDDDVVVTDGVITRYTGSETNIIIPEMLQGQVIRSIGSSAFPNKSLREVDLSNMINLMTIKSGAFAFNSLSAIDLTNLTQLTTIGQAAFYGNSLTELTLPTPMLDGEWRSGSSIYASGATVVDFLNEYLYTSDTPYTLTSDDVEVVNGALVSVQMEMNYANIIIPNNLDDQEIIAIGESAFWDITLTTVDFSALTNLTTIGEGAFYQCDLATVDLSGLSSLTTIGAEAFAYGGSITSINLTGLTNLTTIEANAFDYNLLTSVDFSGLTNLTTIGVGAFSRNDIISLNFTGLDNLKSIGEEAFAYNSLTSVDFSGLTNLTTIGEEVFQYNEIVSLDLSVLTHLTTIGGRAFRNNESLSSIYFTGLTNLTSIGAYAFSGNSLTSIDLSSLSNLTIIGEEAFSDNGLTAVDLTPLTNLTTIGEAAFASNEMDEFILPTPTLDGEWLDLANVIISSGATVSVDEGYYFTSDSPYTLTSDDVVVEQGEIISVLLKMNYSNIVIPNNLDGQDVLAIGEDAFYEIGLKSVDLSGLINLTTIGNSAFRYNSLTTVDLTSLTNLTTISRGAFASNDLSNFTLPSPQTAGYNFDGWLKTGRTNTNYANGVIVNDLDALYTAVVESLVDYTITYESDGGLHDNVVFNYTVEDEVTLAPASKDHYAFDGWFTESEFTNEITALSGGYTGDLTLFAKFTAVDYAITYYADGGSHDNSETYTIEDELTFATATKDGYTFEGWFTDEALTNEITGIVSGSTGEVDLHAKFSAIDYNITYHVSGGSHNNPETYTIEDDLTFNTATKDGYTFDGWFTDEALTNEITGIVSGSTGDLDLHAKFSAIDYTITYHVEGGSHDNMETYTIEDELTFTAAAKDGYIFEGWFTDEALTNEVTGIASGSTGDLDLFVKFSLTVYSITYQTDGGSHDNPDSYTIEDALTLEPATKDGFEFEGWFTDEDLTDEIVEIKAGSTGDMELYAKFSEIILGFQDLAHSSIVLYPNPVVSSFSIDTEVDQIVVLSIDGQLVQSFIGNQTHYDVSHLKPGRYIVQLIDSGQSIGMKKIIINSNGR